MSDFSVTEAVLYRAGIGWFTAESKTQSDVVYFPVATSNLDDFLKTAQISIDGSSLTNLSFEITKKQHLFGLSSSFLGLLSFLRGTDVTIQIEEEEIKGSLLGYQYLEKGRRNLIVNIMVKNTIRNIDADRISEITPRSTVMKGKLQEFLSTLSSSNDETEQKMVRIGIDDKGKFAIYVQFVSDIPAWKVSYRLILSEETSKLHIYGIVDNTTLVDFIDAKLTLSTKLPVSFVYDLSTPHRMRRFRVQRKEETGIAVDRKTASRAMRDDAFYDTGGEEAEEYAFEDDYDEAPMLRSARAGLGAVADTSFKEQAEIEVSESVEFVLNNPVTIKKNESSMVPLTQQEVETNQKHYYNKKNHQRHPFRVVEFENTLEFALDEGPVTILSATEDLPGYAGEAMIDRIPVGEDALILYAVDRDVDIKQKIENRNQEFGISIRNYYLRKELLRYQIYTYEIVNNGSEEISLYLAIPKSDYKMSDSKYPDYRESWDEYRFDVVVESKSTQVVTIEFEKEDYSTTQISGYTITRLEDMLKKLKISDKEKQMIQEIITFKKKEKELNEKLSDAEKQLKRSSSRREQIISSLEVLEEGTSDQQIRSQYIKELTTLDKRINELHLNIEQIEEKLADLKKARPFN